MSDLVEREIVREKMLKYGFTAPDMTVHEFIEDELPSVTQKPNMTWVTGADDAKIALKDVPVWKAIKICEILGVPQERSDKE